MGHYHHGAHMSQFQVGDVVNRHLTVTRVLSPCAFETRCSCGKYKKFRRVHLLRAKSCGCLWKAIAKAKIKKEKLDSDLMGEGTPFVFSHRHCEKCGKQLLKTRYFHCQRCVPEMEDSWLDGYYHHA